MEYPPRAYPVPRATRVRPADTPPVVLRAPDGSRSSGRLEVISLSGGLLSLPRPQQQRSIVKLMFVTDRGPVLAPVEMLPAISWSQQPFRFVSPGKTDQHRLRSAIESWLNASHRRTRLD